jgi:hypothetical protein
MMENFSVRASWRARGERAEPGGPVGWDWIDFYRRSQSGEKGPEDHFENQFCLTGTVQTPNLSLAIQKLRFSKVPERTTSDWRLSARLSEGK